LPASEEAVRALDEKGIDLRPHRSRALTTELIVQSALVVVMTAAQDVQVRCLAPRDAEKVFLLTAFNPAARAGADIEDPIGLPLSAYRAVRDEIEGALPGLTAFMEAIRNRGCENSDRQ
jgi:protein-tyrosine-phosphatase